MVNIFAHEIAEAVTDTANGWYDSNYAEVADKCAWQFPGLQSKFTRFFLLLSFADYSLLVKLAMDSRICRWDQ